MANTTYQISFLDDFKYKIMCRAALEPECKKDINAEMNAHLQGLKDRYYKLQQRLQEQDVPPQRKEYSVESSQLDEHSKLMNERVEVARNQDRERKEDAIMRIKACLVKIFIANFSHNAKVASDFIDKQFKESDFVNDGIFYYYDKDSTKNQLLITIIGMAKITQICSSNPQLINELNFKACKADIMLGSLASPNLLRRTGLTHVYVGRQLSEKEEKSIENRVNLNNKKIEFHLSR